MNDSKLRSILWLYIFYEFSIDIENINAHLDDFIDEFKSDEVSIAASTFGNIKDFDGETVFIPSQYKLVKRIFNIDTKKEVKEIISFCTIEEIEEYFDNASFDYLLAPTFEEDILIRIT